jgi:metal-dependent hydrolase (beta-lactamase superfamily II)
MKSVHKSSQDLINNTCISINVLPALFGDAIHLTFRTPEMKNHHIFIDGGFISTYKSTIKKEAELIRKSAEFVDLFIITHTDRDHIGGVLQFLKEYGNIGLVKQFWFNNAVDEIVINTPENIISISDGIKLYDYLKTLGLAPTYAITTELNDFHYHGARIKVISPTKKILEFFKLFWEQQKNKPDQSTISFEPNDYEYSIDQLNNAPFVEDKRLENQSSIAFIFEYHGKKILFLSDSHPTFIANYLREIGYDINHRLSIDYTILAHHGSKSNTNSALLSLLDCNNFIISANGMNRYNFPHKEPLARILKLPFRDINNKIHFYFNYNNKLLREIFTSAEKELYNFECIYPEGNTNGITIHC